MAFQYLRPDADSIDGGWTNESGGTTLFSSIDESSPNDSDYVASSKSPSNDLVKFRLSDPSGGSTIIAPSTVYYRFKNGGVGDPINLTVSLLQGSTAIATWMHTGVSSSFVTVSQALTSGQLAAITDATDLYLTFSASMWWLAGASIDLDFKDGLYYDSSKYPGAAVLTDYLSCARASTGYAKNSAGAWISFATNQLRITDLGLLIEDARTNYLLNSETPVTQTTSSLATGSYTLWVEGSGSATPSAGSATITGAAAATAAAPNTFTITVAGTVVVTVGGSLTRFQLEAGAFASSYIPTSGATVTRAADAISFTGSLDSVSQGAAASMFVDALIPVGIMGTTSGLQANFVYSASGLSNQILVGNLDNQARALTTNATAGGAALWSTGAKAAWGADTPTGIDLCMGGGTIATASIGGLLTSGPNRIGPPTAQTFAYLRRLAVWNSKLPDATLQALTT